MVVFVTELDSLLPLFLCLVRTQQEDSCWKARGRALTGTELAGA